MTPSRRLLLALASGGMLISGCSVLLDAEPTQCVADGDCQVLGQGYVCDVDVCVQRDGGSTSVAGSTSVESSSTGPGTTGTTLAASSSSSSETTGGPDDGSSSTGAELRCPEVTQYAWSPSIAVVRNACELPGQLGSVMTEGEHEGEVASPLEELPFDICLYGVLAEQLWIGDNGYVTIGAAPPEALQSDVGIPHSLGEPGVPAPGVVPFWDSMRPSPSGVCAAVEGSEPNRTLWLTWSGSCFEDGTNTCDGGSASSLTFSVGFEESTGTVLVGYDSMTGEGGLSERASGQTATTGITNVGPRHCPASECSDAGLCDDGEPCNFTEVASSEIRTLETVQFEAVR